MLGATLDEMEDPDAIYALDTTFDYDYYLAKMNAPSLVNRNYRIMATRRDPMLFQLIYFREYFKRPETQNKVSFCQVHLDACQLGMVLTEDLWPGEELHMVAAPRGGGKSSQYLLAVPTWAMAHDYVRFLATFSATGPLAENWLNNLRDCWTDDPRTDLLRYDFPELCTPMRTSANRSRADSKRLYIAQSGSIVSALGIGAATRGLNINGVRPDLLILDDIEPNESDYPNELIDSIRNTVKKVILPMNVNAPVFWLGTATKYNCNIHQAVMHANGMRKADWIDEMGWKVHHYPPIITEQHERPGGGPPILVERSFWPERYPLSFLQKLRAAGNSDYYDCEFANMPQGKKSKYWTDSMFKYSYPRVGTVTHRLLWIDPAVSTDERNDQTAFALVYYSASQRKCWVMYANGWHLSNAEQRRTMRELCENGVDTIVVEDNQGGQNWDEILGSAVPRGVDFLRHHEKDSKEFRIRRATDYYRWGWVEHAERTAAEDQMLSYPHLKLKDIMDAVCGATHWFLHGRPAPETEGDLG